ncbi:uncharacterized protein METZ01_LOCUS305590, partial [marine metagenome]
QIVKKKFNGLIIFQFYLLFFCQEDAESARNQLA